MGVTTKLGNSWWLQAALVLAWAVATAVGLASLLNYTTTASDNAKPRSGWPADSWLVRERGRGVLVVFVHPHCPCSAATVDELAHITTRCPDHGRIYLLFCRPAGCEPGWEQTALWNKAKTLPGIEVRCDAGGAEARRFGVRASGHALLFGPDGQMLFSGGITRARGHRGDNAGRDAVVSWLRTGQASHCHTPVFGCPLHD
jgi:hypothetical protein